MCEVEDNLSGWAIMYLTSDNDTSQTKKPAKTNYL